MQTQISPEILQRIDALAAKLGITAQYLWSVLIKQAKVEAIEDVVSGLLFAIAVFPAFKIAVWLWKKAQDDDFDNPAYPMCAGLLFIEIIVSSIFSILQLYSAITPTINPEYWALQQVMQLFK